MALAVVVKTLPSFMPRCCLLDSVSSQESETCQIQRRTRISIVEVGLNDSSTRESRVSQVARCQKWLISHLNAGDTPAASRRSSKIQVEKLCWRVPPFSRGHQSFRLRGPTHPTRHKQFCTHTTRKHYISNDLRPSPQHKS